MKDNVITLLSYIVSALIVLMVLPFLIVYHIIKFFWTIFGSMAISFIILGLLGCSYEECVVYSGGLAFFVGVYLKYRELNKN